ncbi:MAG: hypothetical protein K2O01_09105 [Bacteroidales bacterium]|nr:hypothetical protein [Bacteroidales bacterium]
MQPTPNSAIGYHRLDLPVGSAVADDAATAIRLFAERYGCRLVKAVVFVSGTRTRHADCLRLQRAIIRRLKAAGTLPGVPAVTAVEQPPFRKDTVSIDIFYLNDHRVRSFYEWFDNLPYVVLHGYGCRQIWSSGFATPYARMGGKKLSAAYAAGLHSLTNLQHWISHVGLTFDHVIRQWNYIGRILQRNPHGDPVEMKQNYQEFNAAREAFYHIHKRDTVYPAATGIGCDYDGIIIDAVLFESADGHRPPALKSPVQAEAFDYTEHVLVGENAKTPPLFSRARLQTRKAQDAATDFPLCCWISGTASIAGEKTLDPTLPEKQLDNTIQSIESLVATAVPPVPHYRRIRLYLKPTLDAAQAQRIADSLHARFPEEICQVVYADICRDDLWVEIEGETGL